MDLCRRASFVQRRGGGVVSPCCFLEEATVCKNGKDFCTRAFCVDLWAYYGLIWLYVGFACVVPTGNFTSHSRDAHGVEKTRGSKTKRARQDDDRETRRRTRRREETGREKDEARREKRIFKKRKEKKET